MSLAFLQNSLRDAYEIKEKLFDLGPVCDPVRSLGGFHHT